MTKTQTKPKTIERTRRRGLFTPDAGTFFSTGLDLPKPIAKANAAALEARDRAAALWVTANEAAEQAKAAPRFDELAAEAAIAVGEDAPPATAAVKQAAAHDARQAAEAADRVVAQRVSDLYDETERHYDDYLAEREAEAAEARESIRTLVPEMLERLGHYRETTLAASIARDWHNNPNSAALSRGSHNAEREFEKELARQRKSAAHRANYNVDASNDVALLAALALLIEREDAAA